MPAQLLTRIEPAARQRVELRECWEYRELLYFLVWRDLKVRYKQTVLGAAWAVIQPVLTMIVFSIFFGRLAGVPSDGLPYPLFSLAALVPWTFFAGALAASSASVVGSQHVISKVYFPRILLPAAATATPLADFAVALLVLVVAMGAYGMMPGAAVVWLPVFTLLALAAALAASLWLSALYVRYRDVRFVMPFFVQLWLFASPVAYPLSLVPEEYRALYGLNPMVTVIEGFRWALLGGIAPDVTVAAASCIIVGAGLVTGLAYFRGVERTFADVA